MFYVNGGEELSSFPVGSALENLSEELLALKWMLCISSYSIGVFLLNIWITSNCKTFERKT